MDMKIIDLKKTILEDNDKDAELLRKETRAEQVCYLNVMSSPGSGKTSTILALLHAIGDRISCGVMRRTLIRMWMRRPFMRRDILLCSCIPEECAIWMPRCRVRE